MKVNDVLARIPALPDVELVHEHYDVMCLLDLGQSDADERALLLAAREALYDEELRRGLLPPVFANLKDWGN